MATSYFIRFGHWLKHCKFPGLKTDEGGDFCMKKRGKILYFRAESKHTS